MVNNFVQEFIPGKVYDFYSKFDYSFEEPLLFIEKEIGLLGYTYYYFYRLNESIVAFLNPSCLESASSFSYPQLLTHPLIKVRQAVKQQLNDH